MEPVITISVVRVTAVLAGVVALLAVANVALGVAQFADVDVPAAVVDLIDAGAEGSLPTWFSAALMLGIAAATWLAAAAEAHNDALSAGQVRAQQRAWRALSGVFVVLSIDEIAALHERAIVPLRETFGTSGLFYFAWVIPGLLLVALLAAVFWPFLRRLEPVTRRLVVLAGVLFVGGALALEMVGGLLVEQVGAGTATGIVSLTEEMVELGGLVVFVAAVLRAAHVRNPKLTVHVDS